MQTMTESKVSETSPYTGIWNEWQQCIITRTEHADLPHIHYSWYDGGCYVGGWIAVLPGETDEQAAQRTGRADRDQFSFRREKTFRECPPVKARPYSY